ncbi:cytochrome P450 monooxygenase-like protein [Macroventuria anomochaeta]|uniref:Cytochrome P450 monooxygenase-like protein n=1 Tax=Macroventuria anomochaeta TaxID=301207 RepID=A0ACB6RVF4_9PLEO|nr:cytochrome P450 monooxygenase-like protein [Macroventuria anomochaeta]KAF2625088.1 cytochrome P450 monooxygenase-like protein [Macroventuria anomochaeta]
MVLDHHLFNLVGIAFSFDILLASDEYRLRVASQCTDLTNADFFSIALYAIGAIIYNLYFHPLRHIPGPWLTSSTGIPYALRMRSGKILPWIQHLHAQYGDVVRVTPTEVSFISGETAWPDIYGFRTGKYKDTGAYLKDKAWFPTPINGVWSIITSTEADHSRLRRNLSHAFSDKALRSQEPLIMSYVDLLIHKLSQHAEKGMSVDIMRWYNYTTFDIIADLSFGEPLYCLRDSGYHMWVNMVFMGLKGIPTIAIRNKYILFRWLDRFRNLFTDTQAVVRARKEFFAMASARVTARLEKETERPDFFTFILQNQDKESRALTRGEMDANANIFLIAGSETTATTLSGSTYLLLKNQAAYKRLVHEIRSAFKSSDEISIDKVNQLPYLVAVLQEGLRYYPPVPTGFPRIVPGTGQDISGHYIPGGTGVYISQHASNHSARNFTDADAFVPERWLDAERPAKYEGDNREVVQPFSFGPRNCIGKNLAYAEMRLIMAKLLFHFDLALVHPERDWMEKQRVFALWEKPSLDVRLTPVQRSI